MNFNILFCEQMNTESSLRPCTQSKRIEVTAEFQRLNVLLLRAGTGKRIATALMTDAKIQATLGQAIKASGKIMLYIADYITIIYCQDKP